MNLLPGSQFAYVNNFDPLVQDGYANFMVWVAGLPTNLRDEVYQLMDVGIVVERNINDPLGITYRAVPSPKRIRWYPCAEMQPDEESVWKSFQDASSSSETSILSGKVYIESIHTGTEGDCSSPPSANLDLVTDTPDFLRINIETQKDGYLFLADSWYPGWIARVDGVETQIYKADALFRAVRIQPGAHIVEFVYRPNSFSFGAGVSFLSLISLVSIFLFSKHRVK